MELPVHGLLLKDVQGFKLGPSNKQQLERTTVHKGSLVISAQPSDVATVKKIHLLIVNYELDVQSFSTTYLFANSEVVFGISSLQRGFILGVNSLDNRLNLLDKLRWIESLQIGSEVCVTIPTSSAPVKGVVRYIGSLSCEYGTHFGIELLEKGGEGTSDGRHKGTLHFECDHNCAVFVPMDQLTAHLSLDFAETVKQQKPSPVELELCTAGNFTKLMEKNLNATSNLEQNHNYHTLSLPVSDKDYASLKSAKPAGVTSAEVQAAFEKNKKNSPKKFRKISKKSQKNQYGHSPQLTSNPDTTYDNPYHLVVGSLVQFGTPPCYGKIKWIGHLPGDTVILAGVELDQEILGATNGYHGSTRYFLSAPGKGIFVPISILKPIGRDKDAAITQLHQDLTALENQVNELQTKESSHKVTSEQIDAINATVSKLHQDANETEKKITTVEEMAKSNMEAIQRMGNAFQKALDVQKNYEHLQHQLSFTQNQLSLTQQQLLGLQSMMTSSRLWVVSHDQFTTGKEIGRGAWATVHEATFRGTTVAAKCLHDVITSPETKKLFQREMDMALICQHENIVTFLGATMEGAPVILMELMDVNLRKAYEQRCILDRQVLGILHHVVKALHFLHTRPDPVIHRDVSSANVLLKVLYNGEWLAKLGDLGTAKIQQQTATAGPGAIAYGAPETGNPDMHSPKMDVYSFGILILETLTRTHPFQKVNILKGQVQQQYPQYYQLVTSCTKQQSSDRPTMYDVLVQLDGIAATAK